MSKVLEIKKEKNGWFVPLYDSINKKNKMMYINFSHRKGKKYDVSEIKFDPVFKQYVKDYILSFGASAYQQYFDKLGGYSELNHLNEKRKELYYKRHGSDNNNIYSAKFYSHKLLW